MVSASKHVLCGSFLSDVLFEWMSLEDLTKLETATLGCVEIKSMWNGFLLREVKEKQTIWLSGNEASVLQNIRQLAWCQIPVQIGRCCTGKCNQVFCAWKCLSAQILSE